MGDRPGHPSPTNHHPHPHLLLPENRFCSAWTQVWTLKSLYTQICCGTSSIYLLWNIHLLPEGSMPPPTQPTNPFRWLLILIVFEKYSLQPFYSISQNVWLNALLFLSDKILCQETSIIMIDYPLESAHWNNIKNPDIYMLKSEWLWVRM